MFAITGITGNVGGEVARNLLAAKQHVQAVVRDLGKCAVWAERGCDLSRADIGDASGITPCWRPGATSQLEFSMNHPGRRKVMESATRRAPAQCLCAG